jgi:signal transduction histidine kinase/ligand-binding sensor domain-containing protein/DNA-binding response OmpR family regulator
MNWPIRRSVLSVVLFFCATPHAITQPLKLKLEQISVAQGLSSGQVLFILQDSRGFLWFATDDGLNRYDGYEFTVYRPAPSDSSSLSSEWINALYEDKYGDLWINAASRLHRFDRMSGKIVRCLAGDWVTFMCEDKSQDSSTGAMWFGSDGQGLHRFNRAKGTFTTYRYDPTGQNSISSDSVLSVLVDHSGILWIGTANGLNSLDRARQHFSYYKQGPSCHVNDVYEDPDTSVGLLWVCAEDGLYSYDRLSGSFSRYRNLLGDFARREDNDVRAVYADSKGRLWVGMKGGIGRFDRSSRRFTSYQNDISLAPWGHVDKAWFIQEDWTGSIWMAGDGLKKYDEAKNLWREMLYPQYYTESLEKDRSGTMWLGTMSGGLFKIDRAEKQFAYYTNQPGDSTSMNTLVVNGICQDALGMVWVGTPFGLDMLDPASGIFRHNMHHPQSPRNSGNPVSNAATKILEDSKGKLWVGTYLGGVEEYDREKQRFVQHAHDPENPRSLAENGVSALYEDKHGRLWVGGDHGTLEEYIPESKAFRQYSPNYRAVDWGPILAIFEDSRGLLWFGGLGCGLNSYDRTTERFAHYQNDPSPVTGAGSLSNTSVCAIFEDHQGTLWIGTRVGLDKFDRATGTFTAFTVRDGLANDNIAGILEDEHGRLWLGTAKGISRFDPRTAIFRNYDASDGVKFGQCITGYKSKKGEIYFGGTNGFVRFHPDSIRDNPYVPPLAFTSFKIFDELVPLDTVISEKKVILLSYAENVFSFEFAALNYTHPGKNQYAYRLEPFERDWVNCGPRRYASYTNLSSGTYAFHVKASNNDGVWNEEGISITLIITPPWWETTWAYMGYALIGILLLYSSRRYEMNRLRLKHQVELRDVETKKLKQVDEMRSRFFANISHEFRTPLTLILGPIEKLRSKFTDEEGLHDLGMMKRNAHQLLRLINQLLDLSKLEAGGMKLHASRANIVPVVKGIANSFESLAVLRRIDLHLSCEQDEIQVYFDKGKLDQILMNLLSNAFKFTPDGGKVKVAMRQAPSPTSPISRSAGDSLKGGDREKVGWWGEVVEITISDTGIGIPADKVSHVFDRFYQVDDSTTREQGGTGIGLALVRELVELHHGTIRVTSQPGVDTEFIVSLPLGKEHLKYAEIVDWTGNEEIEEPVPEAIAEGSGSVPEPRTLLDHDVHQYLVLIVEDNAEVRKYIRDNLPSSYSVIEASDGAEGINKARETIPELIISDVMMPKKDGYELCRTLKNDEKTSHIPIILLTAKAASENKIEGLETGADDYLIKPFEPKELVARVKNLIDLRRRLRERFKAAVPLKPGEVAVTSIDDAFLKKVMGIVEERLGNEAFSVEDLAGEAGMSRSQLHRKMTALTGQSPSDFIRYMRLHRAMELLKKNAGTVSEIAYTVGFSGVSYFTKCFREQFQLLPSEVKRA